MRLCVLSALALALPLLVGCSNPVDEEVRYLLDQPLVIIERGQDGKIIRVHLANTASDQDFKPGPQGQELIVFGTAFSGDYGASATGRPSSVSIIDGKVNAAGQQVNFRVPIDNELLRATHEFLVENDQLPES